MRNLFTLDSFGVWKRDPNVSVFSNPSGRAQDDASAYIAAVLELLGDRDPMAVLDELVDHVVQIVDGLPDAVLRQAETPGKWSVIDVIRHLADSELVWACRLRFVLAEDRPRISGYDQDEWARRFGYRDASLSETIDLLRVLRQFNLSLIRSLAESDLDRVGFHEERGEESVGHMIRLYAGHDLVHRRQLERIRASLRVA